MARKADAINLTDDDYKSKTYKTAPGGKYRVRLSRKSAIKPGRSGNLLNVQVVIASGPHKGVVIFDNVAPHVGWKIAQLLSAIGKKIKGTTTLQAILKLINDQEIRAVIRETKWEGKKKNEIVQYLPLADKSDDADEDGDEDEDEEDEEDEDSDDEDSEDEEEEDEDEESDEEDEDEEEDEDADEDDDESDDDVEEDEEEEEEEEEEEPYKKEKKPAAKKTPAKKAAAKKAPAKKAAAKKTRRR